METVTHVAVYAVDDVLWWEWWYLRVDAGEEIGERFDKVLPFLLGEPVDRF